jgi:DNA (cytosine-5)-methyltransferase 1
VDDTVGEGLERLSWLRDKGSEPGRIDSHPARPSRSAGATDVVAHTDGVGSELSERFTGPARGKIGEHYVGRGAFGVVADSDVVGWNTRIRHDVARRNELHADGRRKADIGADRRPGATNGIWSAADWLRCRDGKWRPVEPGTFPLADGLPARVGRLRGYGNAIVVPQAAAFIRDVIDFAER